MKLISCHVCLVTSQETCKTNFSQLIGLSRIYVLFLSCENENSRNAENSIRIFFSSHIFFLLNHIQSCSAASPRQHYDGEPLHSVTARRLVRNHIFFVCLTVSSEEKKNFSLDIDCRVCIFFSRICDFVAKVTLNPME